MNGNFGRGRGVGTAIVVVLLLLVIGGIIYTVTRLFGNDPAVETRPDITSGSYSVRMRVISQVEAEEQHEEYQITVTPNERQVEIFRGYANDVRASQHYGNAFEAFDDFASALDKLNYGETQQVEGAAAEMEGACPNGTRYVFDTLNSAGRVIASQWTSSCRNWQGTLHEDISTNTLKQLFDRQAPDLKRLQREVARAEKRRDN